ncbi:MAG: nicotinic acid mononucleotide adenylyltransferase [Acidobacteria bacterium]|nr:MAG: nicotinic acid mononucleotide adenylyltransferase [Acidobacteriota bacterium]
MRVSKKIAILGGTFDPIHNGHLAAADTVASTFQVDEVHFVPAFSPPHKQSRGITSPFHRFSMVALATLPFDRFRTSTIEVDALEKRYTVETLEAMNRENPGAELLFIIGTDMYQEIEAWKNFRRLFDLAHLVIVNRPGFPFREDVAPFQVIKEPQVVTLPEKTAVFYLPFVELPISSTEIRDDRRRGAEVRQWLPPLVWSYIERNKLYS